MDEVEKFGFQCCLIAKKPKILLIAMDVGSTGFKRFPDGSSLLFHLSEMIGKGHIIVNPWWAIGVHGTWTERLKEIAILQQANPHVLWHFFCNDSREVEFLINQGFDAHVVNHNVFAHEAIFKPIQTEKKFRAIYNAKMVRFKRHELAKEVEGLALIYSKYGEPGCYSSVKSLLSSAYFINGNPEDSTYRSYDSRGVVSFLNSARVGLCLSREEGAMYASIEYLLCGLPIVSTRSTGGRDTFFDSEFCFIVDDNAAAIAEAVERVIQRNFDPQVIRAETLKKLWIQRRALIAFIEKLHAEDGENVDGNAVFEKMVSVPWACWTWKNIRQLRIELN